MLRREWAAGGGREGFRRGVLLLSEPVNNVAQVGDSQTRSSDRVRSLDGLTRDADGLVELATLG